jgi:hypothetical protein
MLRTDAQMWSAMLHAFKSIKPVVRVCFIDCFALPHMQAKRCGVKRQIANC